MLTRRIVSIVSVVFRTSANIPRVDEIQALAKAMSDALDLLLLEDLGVEVGTTQIVVTDDFVTEVEAAGHEIADHPGESEHVPFTVDRLGGVAVAKTLPKGEDYRDATIVVDRRSISWQDTAGFAAGIALLAHELVHVGIGRARWACGALEGVIIPSITGTECARSIARISSEEYRATVLANRLLGTVMSVSLPDGESRGLTVHDVNGDYYSDQLVEVLDDVVHPGWPNTVMDYRLGGLTLSELTKRIIESTDQVFTLLGHAEAHAEAGARPRPLDACAGHRGVQLYLAPAWERLIAPARTASPIPLTLVQVRMLEDAIVSAGEAAILAMWSALGLTVEEQGNRQWALWVADPQR